MTDTGWGELVAGMSAAGLALEYPSIESTAGLDAVDRTDARLALLRALNNLLGRFEIDRDAPELVPFNGWREKFFMDNPDYRYWITDIRDDGEYRIVGNIGDSVYQSVTVYAGTNIATTTAVARIDSDDLSADTDGNFAVTLSRNGVGHDGWLELPPGSTSVWVRYVHDAVRPAQPGWCRIEIAGPQAADASADHERLDRDLSRLGAFLGRLPKLLEFAVAADLAAPNTVRHWTSMTGGAAFTEPGIHYLRGAWQLEPDEALVVEGPVVACRHWNIVLYNRFLNSLDYRHRIVSRTAATSSITDGRFRFMLADRDPQVAGYDWLDTERRSFGLFVMRFLQPAAEPELPTVRRVALGDLT
ncbi:hypothetical protein A5634_06590 [Mycobacterium asiaticum]|uniref:DUF1214 domain-containing protein n=1 Tax=Mycobacterium asiaticum TaxID=1790 RepID=A0A1A3NR90_MYCAS|nr:DUF1214 domain-containing protein [Mycobacterium asiaticum]OBK22847.1 hypothetical protein A5634_06590 [Mycobacterium asiaticum]